MSASVRHVRFGVDDRHISDTPSPSWSDASLPSSTGPITPPNRETELPMHSAYRAQPALSASKPEGRLVYDLSLPPHTVSLPSSKANSNMRDILMQSAAVPNLHLLEFSHPKLGKKMYIHARTSDPTTASKAFLTVADVMKGLYANLREPVSEKDFNKEPKERRDRITRAFLQRISRVGKKDGPEYRAERDKGLKRIDWLEGEDMFLGFEHASDGVGHHWSLVTGAVPDRV